MIDIKHILCAGCGVCVDACPCGAISLDEINGVAMVDARLCNECLVCLDVCPNAAIQHVSALDPTPAVAGEVVEGEVLRREVVLSPWVSLPATSPHPGRLAALTGGAMTFVASWLLPRAAAALVYAFERRLAGGTNLCSSVVFHSSGGRSSRRQHDRARDGRSRRRRRQRGG